MLATFCFIDKNSKVKKVNAKSLKNIYIANRYCVTFPCVLSLEENVNNIPENYCGNNVFKTDVNGNNFLFGCDEGKFVYYDGKKTIVEKGRRIKLVCDYLKSNWSGYGLIGLKRFINNNVTYNFFTNLTTYVNNNLIIKNIINKIEKYNVTVNITKNIIPSLMPSTIFNVITKTITLNANNIFTKQQTLTKTCSNKPTIYKTQTICAKPKLIYNTHTKSINTNIGATQTYANTLYNNLNKYNCHLVTKSLTTKPNCKKITKTVLIPNTVNKHKTQSCVKTITLSNSLQLSNSKINFIKNIQKHSNFKQCFSSVYSNNILQSHYIN